MGNQRSDHGINIKEVRQTSGAIQTSEPHANRPPLGKQQPHRRKLNGLRADPASESIQSSVKHSSPNREIGETLAPWELQAGNNPDSSTCFTGITALRPRNTVRMAANKLEPASSASIVYFNTYFVVFSEAASSRQKQPFKRQPEPKDTATRRLKLGPIAGPRSTASIRAHSHAQIASVHEAPLARQSSNCPISIQRPQTP